MNAGQEETRSVAERELVFVRLAQERVEGERANVGLAVVDARRAGATWREIGAALGTTKQVDAK